MASAASRRFAHFDLELAPNTDLALWERLQSQGWLHHLHRLLYRPFWPQLRDRYGRPVATAYRQVCFVAGQAPTDRPPQRRANHQSTNP